MNLAALLEQWAGSGGTCEVESVLERALGRTTPPACATLAAQGKAIVTVVDADASGERVRACYGPKADVRVAGNDDVLLPKCDLVLIHGARPRAEWHAALASLAKHATKLVMVVVDNPMLWSRRAHALMARVTGEARSEDGVPWGRTADLAPLLWEIGRVKDHVFLDVPPLGQRAARLAPAVAPRHAFVIDVAPRTPQARRRLRLEA